MMGEDSKRGERKSSVSEKEENGLVIRYDLRGEEVQKALKIIQKKKRLKKNIVYTALCGAILLINLIDVLFRNHRDPVLFLFIVLCIGILFAIWYLPVLSRKKTAQIIHQNPQIFCLRIYDTYIQIDRMQGEDKIKMQDPNLFVFEEEELFLILFAKEEMVVLPKRCLDNPEKIRKKFGPLGARFQKIGGKDE